MKQLNQAIAAVERGPQPLPASTVRAFVNALTGFSSSRHDAKLAAAAEACLGAEASADVNLARVAGEQIRYRFADGDPLVLSQSGMEVLRDPLCIALLRHARNVDAGLEIAMTRHRRAALIAAGGEGSLIARMLRKGRPPSVDAADRPVVCAIALQCHTNDYVPSEDAAEAKAVGRLAGRLDAVDWSSPGALAEWSDALVLYAMYRPLSELESATRIAACDRAACDPALGELLGNTLDRDLESRERAAALERLGQFADATTAAVRAQYEEHPYPRWRVDPATEASTVAEFVRKRFPGHRPVPPEDATVLIAGCGTGRQAVSAAERFPDSRITATDITLASLGHAAMMAGRLGVGNVRFVHNDILELDALDERFHMIECVGVLHHLAVPERGLEALLRRLQPGGLLRIGVYSEAARRPMVLARRRIAELELGSSREEMRAYRQRIFDDEEPEAVLEVMRHGDFYNLGEFRDMLFHVMEHRYTLAQIKTLLEHANLECIGVEPPSDTVAREYRKTARRDKRMADLDAWGAFEAKHPETFRRMVIFWCRERSG